MRRFTTNMLSGVVVGNLVVSSTPQGDLEADSLFVALGLD